MANSNMWASARGGARRATAVAALCCAVCVGTTANAQVLQTDAANTPLPLPVGTAELNLMVARGWSSTTASYYDPMTAQVVTTPFVFGTYYSPPAFPQYEDGDELTLSGLFKWRHEQIDP